MAESYSAEILRFASSIIAHHGSHAVNFAEKVAGDFRAAGREADARQWTFISRAIHDIEMAVPMPNLNPLGWPARPADSGIGTLLRSPAP